MHARVTRFEGSPKEIDAGIKLIKETVIPSAKQLRGFKSGYWLVDRASGKGFSVTLFESEEALRASEGAAAQLRAGAATTGTKITGVERYEVVAEATAELLAVLRVVVPALGARVDGVHERRTADLERTTDLVHEVDGVARAGGGDVARLRVNRGEHTRDVLLPARVHEPPRLAGRRERRDRAVRRHARELDVGVGVRLVVVQQDERVVLLVGKRRADRAEAHVGPAAVAAERDDVDLFVC